jgi:Flp pilus assembly pilin Flp
MLKMYVRTLGLLNSLKNDKGQDMVEYAIMLGLIAVAAVASVGTVGTYVTDAWSKLAGQF